ncbi:MAG: nucleotidyl transferase AbiEii/AbiGii toxin family protein [Chloroflexota bacterium]
MRTLTYWKTVARDQSNFLERLVGLLKEHGIRYCVIDGQAVNAYVDPLVSLDLDLVVSVDQIERVESLTQSTFTVKRFPHSLNLSAIDSDLRVQIQTDSRYFDFVDRASVHEVLGIELPVASVEDVMKGKVWAAQDSERRASKRQKDLADIARLMEAYPHLREQVPAEILNRLMK